MEEIRFRNHYSVVLEKIVGLAAAFALLLVQNLDELAGMLHGARELYLSGGSMESLLGAALGLLGLLLAMAFVVCINSLVWSKTWITITESAIILEKNTLNRVCNTIGMKNISNVNIEQNIREKILGTCKIKLDTNSLSTANTTDIRIVLKKKRALEIQQEVMKRVNAAQGQEQQPRQTEMNESRYDIIAGGKDILLHGICSVSITSFLVLIGCIGGAAAAFAAFRENITGSIVTILANLILVLGVVVSCFKGMFGGFITYHDFKVGRRGDKIYVHYGLFRTFDYTIPVSKINGVMIYQSLIGRILKKYMVELINVGMGDEECEAGAYLILACDRAQLQSRMELLLPEFASVPIDSIQRQPRAVMWNKLAKIICFGIGLGIGDVILCSVIPAISVRWVALASGIILAIGILNACLQYYTAGSYWDERQLLVANGYFQRNITVMPYENIQHLQIKTNIVLNHLGLVRGEAYLLASLGNQIQQIPVCAACDAEPHLQRYAANEAG